MSKTTVVLPIVSALVAAEQVLGKDRTWNPANDKQATFLENFFAHRGQLSRYSDKELRNWVSRVAAELNNILKDEGFDIQLDDFGPGGFGVVSILDVLVEWLIAGQVEHIFVNNDLSKQPFPGVKFDVSGETDAGEFVRLFEAFQVQGHDNPVVILPTKSGDRVGMTVAGKPAQGLELAALIDDFRRRLMPSREHYEDLTFPMINLNNKDDISWWLVGLSTVDTAGQTFRVAQALQQTKFKMNQFGARVKSAVAVGIECCVSVSSSVVIDKPFYLWIERPGAATPVMYAYLDQDDWKDPGDLANI